MLPLDYKCISFDTYIPCRAQVPGNSVKVHTKDRYRFLGCKRLTCTSLNIYCIPFYPDKAQVCYISHLWPAYSIQKAFFFKHQVLGLSFSSALWRNPVECLFLCIYQTYVAKRTWQHGPQYLNGSWCLCSDGYDMTWWAINMSDMTQMSSERI